MTRADLIAKLRATADAHDDAVSDLLLEAADALEAERRDAVAFLRRGGKDENTRHFPGLTAATVASFIECGDHEGAS